MALNKLKKWIGTQAMTAFFDQLNDNVDATNAAIDDYESLIAGGQEYQATLQNGWTGTLSYKINDLGQVSVWGSITPGTVANGTQIAQLPHAPKYSHSFPVYDSGSGVVKTPLTITATGRIYIQAHTGNALIAGRTIVFETLFNAS